MEKELSDRNYKNYTNNELILLLQKLSRNHQIQKNIILDRLDKLNNDEEKLKELESEYLSVVEEFKKRNIYKKE